MEFIKNLGRGVEKYVLRSTLQFTKNRFKEKTSIVAMIVGIGTSVGFELSPELASAVADGVMVALGTEQELTTANVLSGIVSACIATFLAPTSKVGLILQGLKTVKK